MKEHGIEIGKKVQRVLEGSVERFEQMEKRLMELEERLGIREQSRHVEEYEQPANRRKSIYDYPEKTPSMKMVVETKSEEEEEVEDERQIRMKVIVPEDAQKRKVEWKKVGEGDVDDERSKRTKVVHNEVIGNRGFVKLEVIDRVKDMDKEEDVHEEGEVDIPVHLQAPMPNAHQVLREVLERQDMQPFLLRFQSPVDDIMLSTASRVQVMEVVSCVESLSCVEQESLPSVVRAKQLTRLLFNLKRVDADIRVFSRLALICMHIVVDPLLAEINRGKQVKATARRVRFLLRMLYDKWAIDISEHDWRKAVKFMSALDVLGMNLVLIQVDIMYMITRLSKKDLERLGDVRLGNDFICPFVDRNNNVLARLFPEALTYLSDAGKVEVSTPSVMVVRKSEFGYGCFATSAIMKSEFIGKYVGDVLQSTVEKDRRLVFISEMGVDEENTAKLNRDLFIDATFIGNRTKYLNHSKMGANCRLVYEGRCGGLMIQADEDIGYGEELLLNYGFEPLGN